LTKVTIIAATIITITISTIVSGYSIID